jgi:hypothetical protein
VAEDLGGAGAALKQRDEVIGIVGEPILMRSVARSAVPAEIGCVDIPTLRKFRYEVR